MNEWTWCKCCQEVCDVLNRLGMSQATCYKTVAAWNMTYGQFDGFPDPNPYVLCRKRPLPRLLEVFPDAKDQIVSYAIKNLVKLSIEGVHDFIVSGAIPRLIKLWKSDTTLSSTTSISATGNHMQQQQRAQLPMRASLMLIQYLWSLPPTGWDHWAWQQHGDGCGCSVFIMMQGRRAFT